ncbi:MAG: Asp-tRNA(Asn)/Glu-tRNA(Gln) amidotransferase subunit GatA [Eubacteriales bacterium]
MLAEIQRKLRAGEVTSRALTQAALQRIREQNDTLHAFITVCGDEALRQAEAADARLAAGGAPPLCGIPMALKDNICTAGVRTSCASRMLDDFVPPYSACVWEKLEADGAVLLGKTNMDEFAMGSGGENSAFGPCRNPRDPAYAAGGSSGGSAAAVAAGMAFYALGSDTGGSVRVPAAYCGVVGVKPSYGRISRRGVAAFASSLDQIGVLAHSVRDSMEVLHALCGRDAGDMTTADIPPGFVPAPGGARGLRVGVLENIADVVSEDVCSAAGRAAEAFSENGAVVRAAALPPHELAYAAYYILSACEASSNLARYDGVRFGRAAADAQNTAETYRKARAGFGTEVKRRLLAGTAALSAEDRGKAYEQAARVRSEIARQMRDALSQCDVILTPTAPRTAYHIGERDGMVLPSRDSDLFTVAASLAGLPAISLPAGSSGGLPIGVQLIAAPFREDMLYRAALFLEEAMRGDG